MLDQDFPTGAILRQEVVMLLRVLPKVCGQFVSPPMTVRLLVSGLPVVAFILVGGGGGAAGSAPARHRPIMQREKESIDCDMPDLSNAEPSTPLKHCMTTADGSPLPTDAMLVDQDERNPVMPLSSADCPVPIDQPPRNKRCPKAKKPKKLYTKRQGGDHRREFQGQGWQSRGPPPSDSSL